MAELPPYRAKLEPAWIDFNGHVRDAYYTLVSSYAVDDVMDLLGLDAEYRARTRGTLYTVELHIHYLHEIKLSDDLTVRSTILDFDRKRIHLGCRFLCSRLSEPAAACDMMLLHVIQGEKPATAPFPQEVAAKLESFRPAAAEIEAFGPLSRRIELKRRS
ncbi:MAG TPA: thioesterase family protein [Steroidobacteraceae bacterium]|nr:thioesterase family protein [Steroidobacteraceae bacterium]